MKNGEYEMIIPPLEYPGKRYRGKYAYEHHVAYWQKTGEIIKEGEVIHHVNENKRDNNPSNLVNLKNTEHSELHDSKRVHPEVEFICAYCGKPFIKKRHLVAYKVEKGQKDFYCDRSCMSSHYGRGRSKERISEYNN